MSTGFRYNPYSQSTDSLKVLIPEEYKNTQVRSVDLVGPDGEVIETGNYKRFADNRENYHFSRPGWDYPSDVRVRMVTRDGKTEYYDPKDGLKSGERGPGGSGGSGGVGYSPGGNPYVQPGAYNFGALPLPYVDFDSILSHAQGVAGENRDTYYNEITGEDAKNAALGLVKTDLEGINLGLDTMIPRIRAEGDQDTRTNIGRAGVIDDFNMSRIPGINSFNRGEVGINNDFNQQERADAVDSSGINYRDRIGTLLDQLTQRSQGVLPDALEDNLRKSLQNRGADFAGASGVDSMSRAGIRATDRLTVGERVDLATDAERMIPGVLTQAQQVLQSPEERAPTIFAEPTNVPLNPSNIADRIPIQSNISAGQTQLHIGEKATDIGTIDAENVFTNHLATERFNQSAGFNGGLAIGDRTQSQITASDNALQGALNADKADEIRAQQFDQFQEGLDTRSINETIQGVTAVGGILGGTPSGSQQESSLGNAISSAANTVAGWFGYEDTTEMGGQSASGAMYDDFINSIGLGDSGAPSDAAVQGEAISDQTIEAAGGFTEGDGGIGNVGQITAGLDDSSTETPNVFQKMTKAAADSGIDFDTVVKAGGAVANWSQYTPVQQLAAASSLGTTVLKNQGMITPERAKDIDTVANALSVISNPNASAIQKSAAIAQAGVGLTTTSYTGSINQPKTIGGNKVIGSTTVNGGAGYLVQDAQGNVSSVSREDLVDTANSTAAISAFQVLTSNASSTDKLAALSAVGIKAGVANNMISEVNGGNLGAALMLFQTARNFDKMTPLQQAASVMQTSSAVLHAASGINTALSGTSSAATALSYAGSASQVAQVANYLGTAGQIAAAAYTAYETTKGVLKNSSLSKTQREKANTNTFNNLQRGLTTKIPGANKLYKTADKNPMIAMALSPAIFGLPIAAGKLASVGGSGKNTGQVMRDNYRKGLKDAGVLAKDDKGAYNVTLADGSTYDIGKDGNAKLVNKGKNIDGKTERNTFDVDWSNPVARASIPEAHLFALATGLDPTNANQHGLFDRSVAQVLNAATSNTDSVEGVRDNFKAMMKKMDPVEIAGRVELLRNQDLIADEEYGVYINSLNKMFGTKFEPTDKAQSTAELISALEYDKKNLNKDQKELLDSLTDTKKLEENKKKLNERLGVKKDDTDIKVMPRPSPRSNATPVMKDPPRRTPTAAIGTVSVKPTLRTMNRFGSIKGDAMSESVKKDVNRIRGIRASWT